MTGMVVKGRVCRHAKHTPTAMSPMSLFLVHTVLIINVLNHSSLGIIEGRCISRRTRHQRAIVVGEETAVLIHTCVRLQGTSRIYRSIRKYIND